MRVLVITPPDPVVTLDEVKAHCRVDDSDEDALLEVFAAAATSHIDGPNGWLGRALGAQVLEARCDVACGGTIRLPFPPVIELVSVSYLDAASVEHMADLADVELMGRDLVATRSWPWTGGPSRREAVRIRYRAGYPIDDSGDSPRSTLPASIRAAILLMTDDLYRNRGEAVIGTISSKVDMSPTVANLLAPFRVFA